MKDGKVEGNMGNEHENSDFSLVPTGPFKGHPWRDVPALTLHSILNAVDFGLMELEEGRVLAIRRGLRSKDEMGKVESRNWES